MYFDTLEEAEKYVLSLPHLQCYAISKFKYDDDTHVFVAFDDDLIPVGGCLVRYMSIPGVDDVLRWHVIDNLDARISCVSFADFILTLCDATLTYEEGFYEGRNQKSKDDDKNNGHGWVISLD